MKHNIAFLTTIYPGCVEFYNDFVESLRNQSFKKFDLIVVNENVDVSRLGPIKLEESEVFFLDSQFLAAVKNRIQGLNYVVSKGYEIVVLGDFDDTFDCNRVEESVRLLDSADIVVNDLSLVDKELNPITQNYLSKRLENHQLINRESICIKNVCGLSNTALHTKIIPKFQSEYDLVAFDWFMYAKILENSSIKAIFTNEITTKYRLYDRNIAGLQNVDENSIMRGVEVKYKHYKQLAQEIPRYEKLLKTFQTLWEKLKKDMNFRRNYIDQVKNTKIEFPLWWEEIQPVVKI